MSKPRGKGNPKKGKKVRVQFRRNRLKPRRIKDWTERAEQAEGREIDSSNVEHIVTKGDLSRKRTIFVSDDDKDASGLRAGIVVALRGLFAEVDDGEELWTCTVRRILLTRLIEERHPVTVGDRVHFKVQGDTEGRQREGVICEVEERKGELKRLAKKRVHTIVANVDYAVIVTSAAEPYPKPHLVDRYIVASHAGGITPVVCMNKIDLDKDDKAAAILGRYTDLGYRAIVTSAETGVGLEELRDVLKDRACVIAGQSGVGKSSLLNAIEPGLQLRVGVINDQTQKGRHTTTTASLIKLSMGGYVVDTPGVKSFDISPVPPNELEMHFVEFEPLVPNCKFADCTHTHEDGCAVKTAVEEKQILFERYESYTKMFQELTEAEFWER